MQRSPVEVYVRRRAVQESMHGSLNCLYHCDKLIPIGGDSWSGYLHLKLVGSMGGLPIGSNDPP